MSEINIQRVENGTLKNYKCNSVDELKQIVEAWKTEFRKLNKIDSILKMGLRDKYYESYCKQLDLIIKKHEEE